MKHLMLTIVLICLSIGANSQDTYLSGRITGFDVVSMDINRPVDIIKMKGYIILDSEDLVIQTKRKGKEWVREFTIESIKELGKQDDFLSYQIAAWNFQEESVIFYLEIYDNESWNLEYTYNNSKWIYAGLTMKRWVIDYKN